MSSDDVKQLEALLEAEPSSGPAATGPDIPALREQLAVLVSTGKAPAVAANSQADIAQQATTPTPTTRVKNPKRVAAGKRVAERTRIAREQQKKAAAEASVIIANNSAKATAAPPEPTPTTEKNSGLSVNQWIGIGGLAVSLAGIYYKREELKAVFKKNPPEPEPASVEPEPAREPQRKGVRHMD